MRRTEAGSIKRAMLAFLITVMMLGLVFVVGYLLSDINTRHYRFAINGDTLVIERGRFFPVGFVPYVPDDEMLRAAYAPVVVPRGEPIEVGVVFAERSEIDRALFARLSAWARQRLLAQDAPTLEMGVLYVKRLEILPSLSEGQRSELRGMRADAALRQAEGLLRGVHVALRQAQSLFEQAIELGTAHTEQARAGITEIGRKLHQLGDDDREGKAAAPPVWQQAPNSQPAAP